jgi:hypothetical protein
LGVLKFHSQVWKTYALKDEPPQTRWLQAILGNPARVNEQILAELAAMCAPQFQDLDKKSFSQAWGETTAAAKGTGKALVREALYWYGAERWPVGPLLRWRMKQLRSRQRVRRGLPP